MRRVRLSRKTISAQDMRYITLPNSLVKPVASLAPSYGVTVGVFLSTPDIQNK